MTVCTARLARAQAVPLPARAPSVHDSVRVDSIKPSAKPDSLNRDSSKVKELLKWEKEDSVMTALLNRKDYNATRYQGDKVTFNAATKGITIIGRRAGVSREGAIIVGDTIVYSDSTKIVVAYGDSLVLRDPNQGADDVTSRGRIAYNVESHRGTVTNISTAIESGEKWYIRGAEATFVGDTSKAKATAFYAKNGIITSCDDSIPDYYFKAAEIKMVSKNILVARPAVLYISDVPILYLPFMFQDMRSGRRSGILTPRFGVSELFRNSPTYRRHAENLGYYFAINEYMDAQAWMDWRSGSRPSDGDPGWVRLNGEWRYRWLDRFVTGRLALSHLGQRDGTSNTALSWAHQQDFSQVTHLTTSVNYMTNTSVQRRTTFDPRQVLASIVSQAAYSTVLFKLPLSVGGDRTQYSGRSEVSQNFPNISIQQLTFSPTKWLDWTPSFSFSNAQHFNIDQAGEFAFRYVTNPNGVADSVKLKRSVRNTAWSLQSPLKIAGWDWTNSFTYQDQDYRAPASIVIVDPVDTAKQTTRVFARTFSTEYDWQTGFRLPSLLQGSFNLSPSISFNNVDGHGFWLRTEQSGGKFVHQTKRISGGLGITPTFFALFPGFGPITRIRHSVTPTLSWSVAPHATVPAEYLKALNISPVSYLGSLAQNQLTLNVSQVFEAKLRSNDTSKTATEDTKIKLLAMNFSRLSYDFERARAHHSGFTTDDFNTDFTTDLLPGFRGNVRYSLYEGNVLSDSARFKPFRTDIGASFTLNGQSGLIGAINRVFGRAVPEGTPQIERLDQNPDDALANRVASTPVAGSAARNRQYSMPTTEQWQAQFTFTSSRQRPPTGNGIIVNQDPGSVCAPFIANALNYQQCLTEATLLTSGTTPLTRTTAGSPFIRIPTREALQSQMSFHITPKWAAQWGTTYDVSARQFASQQVSLQRELHDWRAIFAFTQAPNGNFAFNFSISLNAEPDLRFPYDKQTYRPASR
ncbi:MAG: hypothetical protein M3Z17_06045 [Gemmatimonadota bacterium]|nr:hypothetical protein [Gemmatimonadota bacterium]